MKRLWILLLVALLACHTSMPVRASAAGRTLRVAYEENNPYYAYLDEFGRVSGLQVDIFKEVTEKMDVEAVQYYPCGSISQCIQALENGEVDVVLGFPMLYDGDTSNIMISSEIHTVDLCMMASKDVANRIASGELDHYTAVFEHNINNYTIVSNLGARLYFVVGTQKELVDNVLSDRAQVMVCDEDCVTAILETRGMAHDFAVLRSNITTVGYAVAVRKGDDTLLRSINDGIIKIRMSGQYEIILRRWSKTSVDAEKLVKLMMCIIAAVAVVVLVYFIFSAHLRRMLKRKIAQGQEALAEHVQQLQYEGHLRNQILEYAPSMMILCGSDGSTILMNAAARRLTGCEGNGQHIHTIPVVRELVLRALEKAGLSTLGTMEDVPVVFQPENGKRRSYRCTVIEAQFGERDQGFLLIIADVTAEDARTQEMIEREKSAALTRLVAGIAHEVKNPLTGIQNFADLIITERENPEFWDYFAQYVPQEIKRITSLIESLMHYASPAKGVKTLVEAAQLVRESMVLLNTAASTAAIRVDLKLEEKIRIYVEQDRIKQVLINLLLNALQAVEQRRQEENARDWMYQVTVSVLRQDGDVLICVADQGNGMTEEEQQSCAEPFYTTKEKGTGLGLAISRQFVQENGGTMTIDSVKGEGTTIMLRFKETEYE